MIELIKRSFARAEACPHGGKVREYSSRFGGGEILDFSANINPLGSPPLDEVFAREIPRLGHYPDNEYAEYRCAAAIYAGVDPASIVVGNGSSEIIRLFAETVLMEGEIALIPSPTFGEYAAQSRLVGAEVEEPCILRIPLADLLDDGSIDRAKAAFICNPNNPTGHLLSRREAEEIAIRFEEQQTFLLLDEAFIELSDPEASLADLATEMEFLVVMRSLTKSFGVPGLRLGFAVTNPALAEVMNRSRIPWSIGSIAAAAGAYLLTQTEFLEESRRLVQQELAWLSQALKDLDLHPLKSCVNFILVDVRSTGMTSVEIARKMAEERVLVRDCSSFACLDEGYIRLAVRTRSENQVLIAALGRVLECRG
ncbi:MAG: threonine-phosphate decarboxylase [Methanotrichaceae archaeon]|nr:threonine-phosphate decarboxylase [Methanotrichaceae archaeon]